MVRVDAEGVLEMASVEDQEPVQALGADSADEPFSDRVRLRRSDLCFHDPYGCTAEDLVEGAAVLAVAIADEEAHAAITHVEAEVLAASPTPQSDSLCSRRATRGGSH